MSCGHTDRHDKANSPFLQLHKHLKMDYNTTKQVQPVLTLVSVKDVCSRLLNIKYTFLGTDSTCSSYITSVMYGSQEFIIMPKSITSTINAREVR